MPGKTDVWAQVVEQFRDRNIAVHGCWASVRACEDEPGGDLFGKSLELSRGAQRAN